MNTFTPPTNITLKIEDRHILEAQGWHGEYAHCPIARAAADAFSQLTGQQCLASVYIEPGDKLVAMDVYYGTMRADETIEHFGESIGCWRLPEEFVQIVKDWDAQRPMLPREATAILVA